MINYSIEPEIDETYLLRVYKSSPNFKRWVIPCVNKEIAYKALSLILTQIIQMDNTVKNTTNNI